MGLAPATAIFDPDLDDTALDAILALLRERTGIDFASYRRATIARRTVNRMISVGARTFEQYLKMLRGHEDETCFLLERLTIKVSRFYRNAATFDVLRREVIPSLAQAAGDGPVRAWSIGCGQGEEPYTLAMLFDEAGLASTICASDIDPRALAMAARGRYSPASLTELPGELREQYFDLVDGHYDLDPKLRTRVDFVLHDITSDRLPMPATCFDLICCRNVLIYVDRRVQERALQRIRGALRPGGFLCLGEAEWPLPAIAATVRPLAHATRLFRAYPDLEAACA